MSTFAYLRNLNTGEITPVEIIAMSPVEGVPPRPTPGPDPDAPHPAHPIALPGDPWWGQDLKPTHPIALPGDPWWPKPPKPDEPPAGKVVIMRQAPEGTTPPAELSPDAAWVQVIMAKGSPPAWAKVNPYAAPV